ncbi:MAG: hypothetical protein HY584_05985 [Candidatus Omnitrophica bacterium]|nr:hypothetical protein [Candidatus Omnitrophota bacterium]
MIPSPVCKERAFGSKHHALFDPLRKDLATTWRDKQVIGMIPSERREQSTEYREQKVSFHSFLLCSLSSVLCNVFLQVVT